MNAKKDCAGTYPVSGYVKKDGTEVSAYMRTCGAKHEGSVNILNNFLASSQKIVETSIPFKDAYHKYYKLSLDYENQKQFNKDNVYKKLRDIKDERLKQLVKDSYSYISDDTDVVIPQYNTELYNAVMNSPILIKKLKSNFDNLIKGFYKNKIIEIELKDSKNTSLILGKIKLYNMRVVDDYICGTLVDYYDFEELAILKDDEYNFKFLKFVNNNAYYQQEIGQLHNYLILMPIRFSLENLE